MTLTPHEILKHFGIDVPQEGITTNPNDAFLHTQLLSILGKRMAVGAVLVGELSYLDAGLLGIAQRAREGGKQPAAEQLERLRTTLRLISQRRSTHNLADGQQIAGVPSAGSGLGI